MDPITIGLGLAQMVPSLLKYFTGSDKAASVAQQVIGIAQTVTGTPTGDQALAALQASPELQLQFQTKVMEQEASLDQMYLTDTQNARSRDIEIIKSGHINNRANLMALLSVVIVVACLAVVVWKSNLDEFSKSAILLITGRALGWVEQVFSFEFGTTRSNKTKDDTINNLSK